MSEPNRDLAEPIAPALRPQFGLRAMTFSLVAVSLTFALTRWLPAAVVLAIVFSGGLVALHVFSTTLGSRLRATRSDERSKRQPLAFDASLQADDRKAVGEASRPDPSNPGELRERRSIASFASWAIVLAAGACLGVAWGWAYVVEAPGAEKALPSLIVPVVGLAAFGFLGALAGGLSHALAASLFVAHRQSVQASEAEGSRNV